MITADRNRRQAVLDDVRRLLTRLVPPSELELVLAFAPIVLEEWPDRFVFGLSSTILAARVLDQYGFVVDAMPPPHQLYKGLPGLHVSVDNPDEARARELGGGEDLPLTTTVIRTHTLDAPFILESLKNYCRKSGLRLHSATGAIFTVRRQWERIVWIGGMRGEGTLEAYCHVEVERVESKERLRHIEREIHAVLRCVSTAVDDFPAMIGGVRERLPFLRPRNGASAAADTGRAFLEWLLNDNYVFFGTVRYRPGADLQPVRIPETACGVFKTPELLPIVFPGLVEEVESGLVPTPHDNRVVDVDYCHNAQAIYHFEPIDDIVIREWAEDGSLAGATLLLGRLSAGALVQRAGDIPLLREKQDWLLEHSGDVVGSHVYREIRGLLSRMPKRELLYADVTALKDLTDRIAFMTSDYEVIVKVREGTGYVSVAVAFSRVRYSYVVEERLQEALREEYGPHTSGGSTDCGTVMLLVFYFDSSRLATEISEQRVRELCTVHVRTWDDRAAESLTSSLGESDGIALLRRYLGSLTGLYREATPADEVPGDLVQLESLDGRLDVRVLARGSQTALLKVFAEKPLTLSGAIRTLEHLGLSVTEELRIPLELPGERECLIYRFEVEARPERIAALLLPSGETRFREALQAIDEGRASDGPLSALVLQSGLEWRAVEMLRALRNLLLQIWSRYNHDTINDVMLRHCEITASIFRALDARFNPALADERDEVVAARDRSVDQGLRAIEGLTEDEILRTLHALVRAMVRTNFYQLPERPAIAVKVESGQVPGMPSPRPLCEIYVHSRRLAGVHLRGGRVARGGIRWSDRPDDFRTEVLGLMKTQMVKNSVIVPVGSKGGFVLRSPLPPRPELDRYMADRYREFVSALLDVTDNVVDGSVIHPPRVERRDGDDPYLVVAADKGTAHLSDTANDVSQQYGFWLGDAFASGGAHGYDHKAVGITARGAWECVRHHFRNLGLDVDKDVFTVAGIGDLAGDVFGNGMLLSRSMKLVAAFNHQHVFVDPDPDPERSYAERERIFRLPRSTWRDYDARLISRGGGVFDRQAKAIPVSPEMRALLDLPGDEATGEEVVRHILRARVDLLYNGGIGTYVKASSEDHADVGDRSNDRVRVDGATVRARVVAEGGNLGLTQAGRLEYWQAGGLLNTDAVDNSGGVDMSDHEVNLKILLDGLVKRGVIGGREERNTFLAELTEDVAQAVLAHNRSQSGTLTLDGLRSARDYDGYVALVERIVAEDIVNVMDDTIPARASLLGLRDLGRGLPRPLLAVLLGRVKLWARDQIIETSFPDSPSSASFLERYFPEGVRRRFGAHLAEHALRREIVATVAVNHVINHAGIAFLPTVAAGVEGGVGGVVATYLDVESAAKADRLRQEIRAAMLTAGEEQGLLLELEDALEAGVVAALEKRTHDVGERLAGVRDRLQGLSRAERS